MKHEGGWTVQQPAPGTFVWRSPLGGEYTTRGEFLLPPMPAPAPVDLGPEFDVPTRTVDGPILQRPATDEPRERPPPPPLREYPDEPPF